MESGESKKMVFVTVGTTSFDALVRAVDSPQVRDELSSKGYTHLLIQMGRGSHFPSKVSALLLALVLVFLPQCMMINYLHVIFPLPLFGFCLFSTQFSGEDGSLAVDYFTFSPSIADHLKSASLIISHAGSGSIFETLRLGKPLIVVVNEDLMDNHQSELAEALADRKYLFCANPQTLHQIINSMNLDSLVPYPPGDSVPVAKLINRFFGFPDD